MAATQIINPLVVHHLNDQTRFICARKSRHRDHRGEIRQRSAAVTFAMDARETIKTLAEIAKNGTPGARVSAAIALLDRAYGKPPQFNTGDTPATSGRPST